MKRIKLLIAVIFISVAANAQTFSLSGFLQDLADNRPLAGASVRIAAVDTTGIEQQMVTDTSGKFIFSNLPSLRYQLTITTVGYEVVRQTIRIDSADLDMGSIPMSKESKILGEVNVTVTTPPVRQKLDTLEYSANAFKVNPDANAEDMIKKMPGVTVDKGTVTAQGEQVRKVTIDGREFFGDDATAALRNMPAEVIDKIQVFDRLSDQAQFTGFDDGNAQKSINIVTKANMRSGNFGRVYAGYGTDERYSAGGNVSFFNGDRRISFVGLANNVNQQNFAAQDLLGATSTPTRSGNRGNSGGGRPQGGGGGRPQGQGGGGNANNFLVGQQSGIAKTNSFGINYSNIYAKKLTVSGSYFYNNSNTNNDEESTTENFLPGDSSRFYNERSLSETKNYNNRVNLRVEYKIDSSNTLLFTPSLSFQNNKFASSITGINSFNANDLISESFNTNNNSTSGYNLNSGLLYRHAFAKRGRTISFNLNGGLNNRDGENYLQSYSVFYKTATSQTDSIQQFSDQSTKGYNISGNIAYTEPIGKKSQLQFNYNPSFSSNKANQQTFQFNALEDKYSTFDPGLSNKFDNTVTTQNGGVSFRSGDRDNMYSVGLNYQNSQLESDQYLPYSTTVNKSFSNILPNAMLRLKLSAKSNIRLNYRSSTNNPSISQLQDVLNIDNPLFVRTGNPELQQQFSNTFFTRYQYTNIAKGQSMFANVFFTNTRDYVANAVYFAKSDSLLSPSFTLREGSQLAKPVNLDGYWSLRSFFTFGMPLRFIKSNINWNVGYTYSKIPGMIDNVLNFSQNHNYNIGAVIASNISEYVDFNLSYSANFNNVKTSTGIQSNNKYFSHNAGVQLNLLSKNGWVLQNDLNNTYYSGLSGGFNQNFWLWNISAGKKFLKDQAGELRLSVFDLLKQNNSITRTVTETYIEDVRNQVLQQYFMLTFSYRLKTFIKK